MRLRAGSVIASFLLVLAAGGVSAEPAPRHATSEVDWLSMVNFYRQQAGLAPYAEDHEMSDSSFKHAYYIVKTNTVGHEEDHSSPYFTPEGEWAAQRGNSGSYWRNDASERAMFSRALLGPVHGILTLQAHSTHLGYGMYREVPGEGSAQMGTTIGHGRDVTYTQLGAEHFPVMWPGNGQAIPYLKGGNEYPDLRPLCGFPLDAKDWGMPVFFEFAEFPEMPTIHSFKSNGEDLPHCVYRGPEWENFLFMVPRDPLKEGQTYTASMTVGGKAASTTFSVTPWLMTACTLSVPAGQEVTQTFAVFRDNNYMPGNFVVADYSYSDIWTGDGPYGWAKGILSNGSEPNTFKISGTHKYENPGSYTYEVVVEDPYFALRKIKGTINVTAPGTAASAPTCTPPPLPPAPAFPSPRPAASPADGSGDPSPSASYSPPSNYPSSDPPTPPDGEPSDEPSDYPTDDPDPNDGSTINDYRPTLSLKLSRHLKARGVLTTNPAYAACTVGQTVVIERFTRRGWTSVKTTSTDSTGLFKASLRDKPGMYRAYFEGFYVDDTNVCFDGFSTSVRHTH